MATQDWKVKFATFCSALGEIIEKEQALAEREETDRESEDPAVTLVRLLSDACRYVREVEANGHPDLENIIESFDKFFNSGVAAAYRDLELEFLRPFSFTDDAPLIEDQLKFFALFSPLQREGLMSLVESFRAECAPGGATGPVKIPGEAAPWRKARLPHASSSRLSRFRRPFPTSATDATPLAQIIYQARCEITSEPIGIGSSMAISSNGTCLALTGSGGWKNRDPVLRFYTLPVGNDGDDDVFSTEKSITPKLSGLASALALDEDRKLIFVADRFRIKSYSWEANAKVKRGSAVHTLSSTNLEGPVTTLPNGRLIRFGKGSAAIWNLEEMDTHLEKKTIGETFIVTDSWREESEIEKSAGNLPTTTITFADPELSIGALHLHKPSNLFLCGNEEIRWDSGDEEEGGSYSCFQLDIENGGKIVKRFLGHGGTVTNISTSAGDPNTFLTSCTDGCVRLYDTRLTLPTFTLDVGSQAEACNAALLIHPDGIPTILTGGVRKECIMLWDIRARKVVYELSTGNTAVESLAWDERNSTLYAATSCPYVGYSGQPFEYRHAKKPDFTYRGDTQSEAGEDVPATEEELAVRNKTNGRKRKFGEEGSLDEVEDYEEGDEDDWDDWDEVDEPCWPKQARHGENSFGYLFDAAEHRLFSYKFKADADPRQLPVSGWSTPDHGGDGFDFF